MAKSRETFNKKENEKKKHKKKEDKARKKEERKAVSSGTPGNMIAYVDEYGNFSSTPPDPSFRKKVKAEDIEIGVPKRPETVAPSADRTGVVTFFNESKGYGFIKDAQTSESIFTHVNGHLEPIRENDRVAFNIEQGHKGPSAVKVKIAG